MDLVQILAHQVHGMNGSSVTAVGRGKVRLQCRKGWVLILKDVLYAPAASLCLILVGCLCDDGMTASFDATSCCCKRKAGKTITSSTRTGKDLYWFTRDPLRVEHANISCTAPSLKTWHHPLGHISYQAVIWHGKEGPHQSMPVDISALLLICEHCVLGKQTKTAIPKTWEGEWAKTKLGIVCLDITGPEAVVRMTLRRGHSFTEIL